MPFCNLFMGPSYIPYHLNRHFPVESRLVRKVSYGVPLVDIPSQLVPFYIHFLQSSHRATVSKARLVLSYGSFVSRIVGTVKLMCIVHVLIADETNNVFIL